MWAVVGIYAMDIAGRMAGFRVRYVEVEAWEGGTTRIRMKGAKGGWR